jgi:transcriptional regulator with XRE-family HTH domain
VIKLDVRRHRKAKGLSIENIVDETGLSWDTISNLERNRKNTRLVTLGKIADALDMHPSELIIYEKTQKCG